MATIDKKTIQRRRIMGYFINAANQIISEKGVEALTAREVADIAGYNSATLYNYFDNLEHLTFYASLRYLKDYIKDIREYTKDAANPLERFMKIWEHFCHHSFNNPKVYNAIFFEKYSSRLDHDMEEYYSIFPEELVDQDDDIKSMLLSQSMNERNLTILKSCISKKSPQYENIKEINEMIILVYQGMLNSILNNQSSYTTEEAIDKTIVYIRRVLKAYDIEV